VKDAWRINLAVLTYSFGSMSLTPILSPYAKLLGAGTEEVGIVVSAASISSIIFRLFAGALSDRVGRVKVMMLGIILSIAASLLYVISNDVQLLILARVINGVGMALFLPASIASAFDVGSNAQEALAWRSTMYGVGSSAGPILGSMIADLLGYRIAFAISALFYLAGLVLVLGYRIPTRKSQHGIGVKLGGKLAEASLVRALTSVSYWALVAYIPIYLMEVGQPISVFGLFLTICSIFSVVARIFSRNVRDVGGVAFGSAAISSIALTAIVLTLDPNLMLILSPIFGVSTGLMIPLLQFYAISEAPPSAKGFATGIYTMSWDLGAFLGPIIAGVLLSYTKDYRSLTYLMLPSIIVPAALAVPRSYRIGKRLSTD